MTMEIILSIGSAIMVTLIGVVIKKLDKVSERQRRSEQFFHCEHQAMDYSLEINLDGPYKEAKTRRLNELLAEHKFKNG